MARRRYQKGTVVLRGDTWIGRYREDVIVNGKVRRVRRAVALGTKKEYPTKRLAERAMEQILSTINDPCYRPSRHALLRDFAKRWQAEILSRRKPSTRKAAESHLEVHILPQLGKLTLDAIGVENQQSFVSYLAPKVSRKTLVNVVGTLSSMLNTAKNWGYSCEGVTLNRLVLPEREVRREARTFSPEQAQLIIEAAADPWKLMFAIAGYMGLRAGEILGLRSVDVDVDRGVLNIRQTAWYGRIQTAKSAGSETSLPIPELLKAMFNDHKPGSTGLLFQNRRGRAYTAEKVVQKRLWPLCDKLKIPRAGFHAFRHMHASLLLELGATPKVAQRQLRHSDARITLDRYAHLIEGSHREAVEKLAVNLDSSGLKSRLSGQLIQ